MNTSGMKEHFLNLTPGKLMGLRQITDADGRFKIAALDHRRRVLYQRKLEQVKSRPGISPAQRDYEVIRDVKLLFVRNLAPHATAVLLDVNYGLRQALNSGVLPRGTGLIAGVEKGTDPGLPGEIEPGWSVAQIKRMGASAVKLLVFVDTQDSKVLEQQLRFVRQVHDECLKHDIFLLIEPLSYSRLGDKAQFPSEVQSRPGNVIEAARLIGPWCDTLKMECPGDFRSQSRTEIEKNLKKLNDAAIRPWVLLSAGEKFDLFVQQAGMAMQAGASGYMAGRAVFNEYFEQETEEGGNRFLQEAGVERLKQLNALVDQYAVSWLEKAGVTPGEMARQVEPRWFRSGQRKSRAGPTDTIPAGEGVVEEASPY